MPHRDERACCVFLVDRSASMGEPEAGRAEALAGAINEILGLLVLHATALGIAERIDMAVIGYHTDRLARPVVTSLLPGAAGMPALATLEAIGRSPGRMERRIREIADEFTGEIVEETYDVGFWIDREASGGTPLRAALRALVGLISDWVRANPRGRTPLVLHLTDGRSRDGDPAPEVKSLQSLATALGPTLLWHVSLADPAAPASPSRFPAHLRGGSLPADTRLFRDASEVPPEVRRRAASEFPQVPLEPRARGLILNADAPSIFEFLDFATRTVLLID